MSKKTAYGTYNDLAFQFYAKEFLESKEEIHTWKQVGRYNIPNVVPLCGSNITFDLRNVNSIKRNFSKFKQMKTSKEKEQYRVLMKQNHFAIE
jgi:hypothetical protein